jgi:RNA-directed DNA polymerase
MSDSSLFSLANLHQQYIACRRNKRNTVNAMRFEARQELNLLALRDSLVERSYEPARSVCFYVRRPKLREVFAADFRDRVVHHVLVGHLEKIWESVFIHDSYACRKGKGVHAGVARLQRFLRQVTTNGTCEAFYLQLDIHNYFMSIDKAHLFAMLDARLNSSKPDDEAARWLCRKLVSHDCTVNPVMKGDPHLADKLPSHKTLFHAAPGKGLPIGNLNSQFFANVYLNALDQFVKHVLKCRWYLRYCDDFVLLARSAQQLTQWRERIGQFLTETLALQLNPARERLRPVSDGVDFLGYIVRPFHLLVRRRVVGHLREKLARFEHALVQETSGITTYQFDATQLQALQACLASYLGHFKPAASHRLLKELWRANPWLRQFFVMDFRTQTLRTRSKPPAQPCNVLAQYRHWHLEFSDDDVWIQIGAFVERLQWPPRRLAKVTATTTGAPLAAQRGALKRMRATRRGAIEGFPLPQLPQRLATVLAQGKSVLLVAQTGATAGRIQQRLPVRRWCLLQT